MSVHIIEIVPGEEYEINFKNVYKDSEGNWIAREELTPEENRIFRNIKHDGFVKFKNAINGR